MESAATASTSIGTEEESILARLAGGSMEMEGGWRSSATEGMAKDASAGYELAGEKVWVLVAKNVVCASAGKGRSADEVRWREDRVDRMAKDAERRKGDDSAGSRSMN